MSQHFTIPQENQMSRLLALRGLVAEQPLHGTPCPLLISQLNELEVFCERLSATARTLKASLVKSEGN